MVTATQRQGTQSAVNADVSDASTIRAQVLAKMGKASATVASNAAWAEEQCRLHDSAFQAIVDAGVPRLFLPASLRGDEVDPITCALACETLANSDTAAAWHVMVFNAAKLMASRWPAELVELLWGDDPDRLVAASGHTPLKAEKVPGGYRVNGVQRFVSGCNFATWMMSPVLVDGEMYTAVMALSECTVKDNWDTLGMRGSGSNDVAVENIFLPELQVVPPTAATAPPNHHFSGPLFACPSRIVFATYVPTALSLAARALDVVTDLVKNKIPGGGAGKLQEKHMAQGHFGRGLAIYRSARLMFYDALEATWQRALDGLPAEAQHRADLYLAGTHAVQASSEVVKHVADIAGTSMIARGSELERIGRDMETLRHHGFVNESRYASVAQVHWDAPLDYPAMLR